MKTFPLSILACLVLIEAFAQGLEAPPSVLSILDEEKYGRTLKIGDTILIEVREGRSNSRISSIPYMSQSAYAAARTRVLHHSLSRGPTRTLLPEEFEHGHILLQGDPLSPDKKAVVLLKIDGNSVYPIIYDFTDAEYRVINIKLRYERGTPKVGWISDRHLLFVAETESECANYAVLNSIASATDNLKRQQARRQEAWSGGRPTVSRLGGGTSLNKNSCLEQDKLIVYDIIDERELRTLEAPIVRIVGSPDRKSLAIIVGGDLVPPVAGRPRTITAPFEFNLILQDSDRLTGFNPLPDKMVAPGSLSWSPNGRFLAGYAYPAGQHASGNYFLIDTSTHRVNDIPMDSIARSDAAPVKLKPSWIGNQNLFLRTNEASSYVIATMTESGVLSSVELFETPDQKPLGLVIAEQDRSVVTLSNGVVSAIDRRGEISLAFRLPDKSARAVLPDYIRSIFETRVEFDDIVFDGTDTVVTSSGMQLLPKSETRWITHQNLGDGLVSFRIDEDRCDRLAIASAGMKVKQVHSLNCEQDRSFSVPEPLVVSYEALKGDDATDGMLYLPAETSGPHPLIILLYPGRSVSHHSNLKTNEHAPISVPILLSKGYAVFVPNIPLSPAPGSPLLEIQLTFESALDAVLETGLVDPSKVAVSGHSYGGYATLAIGVSSDRVRAVIASAPISNLISGYGAFTPPMRYRPAMPVRSGVFWSETGQGRMGSAPWQDPERYLANSPISFLDSFQAPLLLIAGDCDKTVSITHSEEVFTGLARLNKDVVFLRYWGEGHGILRPNNVIDMWNRVFDFLEGNGVAPGSKTVH